MEDKTDRNIGPAVKGRIVSAFSEETQAKKRLRQKSTVVKTAILRSSIQKPIKTVPFESGFHFYTGAGSYSGITATNLSEFATKLKNIPAESITFHLQRKDFQKWIKFTIKDNSLAEKINKIEEDQSAEYLRREILRTVNAVLV